ncbi:hypothetical protein OsI_29005 [Oryza sativa Indica Group]|uniref:Uncharacterized protein n=1 Tax=Oryza sativa subsp. indica TaxID=39946 RepID=A2YUJ9_ORYSI|nr:hypothetical protein OsI_29005 [Oryza sativa Indica Group]
MASSLAASPAADAAVGEAASAVVVAVSASAAPTTDPASVAVGWRRRVEPHPGSASAAGPATDPATQWQQ